MSSLSGALAGLTAVLVTYPLELVRTRMAFRICTDETALAYRTLTSSFRQVLSQEGALGLTLTLTPTPTLTLTLTLTSPQLYTSGVEKEPEFAITQVRVRVRVRVSTP